MNTRRAVGICSNLPGISRLQICPKHLSKTRLFALKTSLYTQKTQKMPNHTNILGSNYLPQLYKNGSTKQLKELLLKTWLACLTAVTCSIYEHLSVCLVVHFLVCRPCTTVRCVWAFILIWWEISMVLLVRSVRSAQVITPVIQVIVFRPARRPDFVLCDFSNKPIPFSKELQTCVRCTGNGGNNRG